MARIPRLCKKENRQLAMVLGFSLMKEIENKSFQKGAYAFHLPFGEFSVMVIKDSHFPKHNIRKTKGSQSITER